MSSFRWITDIFTRQENMDFRPSSIITSRGSYRSVRSFNNRTYLGRSSNFIEKLQNDRVRDEELHFKSLENIPRQLRSPSRQRPFFSEKPLDSSRKAKNTHSQAVYLRHGHVPPIHANSPRRSSDVQRFCVEPLSIDKDIIVSLSAKTTPRTPRTGRLMDWNSDTFSSRDRKSKKVKTMRLKSDGSVLHDRPLSKMKNLERLNFVNPLLKGRRSEKDSDRNSVYEIESNTTMSAIRSVQEYNDPRDEDFTPDLSFTVEDVFKIKP